MKRVGVRTQLYFTLLVIRKVIVATDLTLLIFKQLDNHVQELCGRVNLFNCMSHSSFAHYIKCFHQIKKHYIQLPILLPGTSLGAAGEQTQCLLCSYWLLSHTGMCSSAMVGTTLFNRILVRIFPVMESRVIPR